MVAEGSPVGIAFYTSSLAERIQISRGKNLAAENRQTYGNLSTRVTYCCRGNLTKDFLIATGGSEPVVELTFPSARTDA